MTGGVLSKLPGLMPVEISEEIGGAASSSLPAKKEVVLAVVRAGTVGLITFYLVRWALRYADPTYQQKQKAQTKVGVDH